MKKRKEKKFIHIWLAIYRCSVVVTWEQNVKKIMQHCKRRGVTLSEEWQKDFDSCVNSKHRCQGLCIILGEPGTPDILVWIKKRPEKASEYGVLYHELYHAVDELTESRSLFGEKEARAFLYEFLVDSCNKVLWV